VADLEAHEQPSPFGLLRGAPDQRAVRDCHNLGGVVELAGRRVDRLARGLNGLLHDSGNDRVLTVEVVVEGAESDVGLVGDLVDPGGVDPLARERRARGFEQARPCLGPAPCAAIDSRDVWRGTQADPSLIIDNIIRYRYAACEEYQ
jgi:hypothetical protein